MRQLTFVEPNILEWREVAEPKIQGNAEALVAPTAVAMCDLDRPVASGLFPVPGPFAFGHEFVGTVVEAGPEAGVQPGAEVVVSFQISCGECDRCQRGITGSCRKVNPGAMYGLGEIGGDWGGALSDLVRIPFARSMLFKIPEGVSPRTLATASDNICDAYRTVAPHLALFRGAGRVAAANLPNQTGADVLIVAGGAPSIALLAVDIARAFGAGRIDYIDQSSDRLAFAEKLGANAIEGPPPRKAGRYPITVDASADPEGLLCAIRSTEPGGVCTSIGIYPGDLPMPLLEMYSRGITFITGRPNAVADLPAVIDLVSTRKIEPDVITTYADWDDAPEVIFGSYVKLVLTRDSAR